MRRNSSDQLKLLSRTIGVLLIGCSVLFGYGAATDLASKVQLRVHGARSPGAIKAYQSHWTGEYPIVSFRTYRGQDLIETSHERIFAWVAPPIGTSVEVCYDPRQPARFHLYFDQGAAQFAWLELPAALAFLCTFLLVTGLRFVLI